MISNDYWKSWYEIQAASIGREIVFFGRSEDWVPKALKKITPSVILDNDCQYENTSYLTIEVCYPKPYLNTSRERPYVVITAGIIEGIVDELLEYGYQPGVDFSCSPDFFDYRYLEDMKSHHSRLIISSSDYNESSRARYSLNGGGLFILESDQNTIEKKVSGVFRQVLNKDNKIYAVEYQSARLMIFDLTLELIDSYDLGAPNYCGITYIPEKNVFALINASGDYISFFDADNFKCLEKYIWQEEIRGDKTSQFHMNDLAYHEGRLYFSYFSKSGAWKQGVFDGGIDSIDLNQMSNPSVQHVANLWKPHSPCFFDGNLHYLDSMRGRLYGSNNYLPLGEFQSFVRGLSSDGKYYYIGASEDMYMSERFGLMGNIILTAGIYMFDPTKKISRFFAMPHTMNVHDVIYI